MSEIKHIWTRSGEYSRDGGKWTKWEVVSETSRSWIIGPTYHLTKIPKKGPWHNVAFSESEIENIEWKRKNSRNIEARISTLTPDTLRKVAELIGYTPTP